MKNFLKNHPVFLSLTVLSIMIVAGFVVWQLIFCPGCSTWNKKLDTTLQEDSLASHFVLETLEGDKVSLSDLAGKNFLLVFWATFCGWCEKERPDLNKFTKEQKGYIEVLAVSGETKEVLKRYIEEKEVNFTILSDPGGKTQLKYLALGTPNHFLIDKQGKIVAKKPGYATYQDLLFLIKSLEEK